jgi:hypothetical protein
MFDPTIQKSKTITMQHMQQAVARGYRQGIWGRVVAVRAAALADKFDRRYALAADKHLRFRRKAAGEANALLFMYPLLDSTELLWWVLRTGPDDQERWCNVADRSGRLCWGSEYELIRETVPREVRRKYAAVDRKIGELTWTWRMTPETFTTWKHRIRKAAAVLRHDESEWRQMVWSLDRVPGFRGVRTQVCILHRYARLAHLRQTRRPYDWEGAPRWVQPRRGNSYPLSEIVSGIGMRGSCWPT